MKNLIPIIIFFLVIIGCKEKLNSLNSDRVDNEDIEVQKEVHSQISSYGKLDNRLVELIKIVVADYPLEEIIESSDNVQQSYYVSFFTAKEDSILAIARQPFLMELFPDFAFENNELPTVGPTYIGKVKDADLPLFIFDSGDIGLMYYDKSTISKEYPEKYLPDDGKFHTPEVPPIYKYRMENNDFILIGKSKKQWIN